MREIHSSYATSASVDVFEKIGLSNLFRGRGESGRRARVKGDQGRSTRIWGDRNERPELLRGRALRSAG